MLYFLGIMMKYSENYSSIRQREGIIQAKKEGKYTGRKQISVDRVLLSYVAKEFRSGKMSEQEAMKKTWDSIEIYLLQTAKRSRIKS